VNEAEEVNGIVNPEVWKKKKRQ